MRKTILFLAAMSLATGAISGTLVMPSSINCKNYVCQICTDANGMQCKTMPAGWFAIGPTSDGIYQYDPAKDEGVSVKMTMPPSLTSATSNYKNKSSYTDTLIFTNEIIDFQKTRANTNFVMHNLGAYLSCNKSVKDCFVITQN